MKKLFIIINIIILSVFCLLPVHANADCATVNDDLTINVPYAEFASTSIGFSLAVYRNTSDPYGLYFRLTDLKLLQQTYVISSAFIDSNLNINIKCASFQGIQYTLYLQSYSNPLDSQWFYWKLVNYAVSDGQNQKPVADSISLKVDSTVPYIVQQLSAHDSDNDTIVYELVSPSTGTGYSAAYINPSSGTLYLTHVPAGNNSFSVSFRVTDGRLFSDPANILVQVNYLSDDNKETGQNDVLAEDYSKFSLSTLNSTLLGNVGEEPTTPKSIDLSANFPNPGDQGNQSSCVGWATAYALKSYQEKVEMGWALNTPEHLFSPAFIYNQINGGQDQGSYIHEALNLAVNKGVSTLAAMSYSERDYRTQPSAAALTEAVKFKAAGWRRVNDTSQIKAALANRKPVVGGIDVYQQLMDLSGSNSVYNTKSGNSLGGHAITIVGYDDDKHGGAFKVINSWSQNWGDNGFFWMPYNFASGGILSEAYVLEDAENSEIVTPISPAPTEPEPDYNTLPNLTVVDWKAQYDPRPRGTGQLTYKVQNTGSGVAPLGADVNLMLSDNPEFTTNDYYVIYETIPFDLKTGESVYRDVNNSITFHFPDQLGSGIYYMALWVDDLDIMEESNEGDNISVSANTVTMQNTLPDLEVKTWYANWDAYGNGVLTYEVINSGVSSTTSTNWYINLILDVDQVAGNGNEQYLFYEPASVILNPQDILYRKEGQNPAYFNLYQTYDGYPVFAGIYYMALWVDDMNYESESNELNNGSYSWGTVSVRGYYGTKRSGINTTGADTTGDISNTGGLADTVANNKNLEHGQDTDGSGSAYNGKKLPPTNLVWKKVEITRRMDNGQINMKMADSEATGQSIRNKESATDTDTTQQTIYSKAIEARTKVIFPTTSSKAMPSASNGE